MRWLLIVLALAALTQSGCSTGYTKIDGEWCYVRINAAEGREVLEIDADHETFEVLADREYAKDKNHAYHFGRPLKGIDGKSYRLLSDSRWAVDRNGVYYKDCKVPSADPETFEALGRTYGRDHTAVYCGTLKMEVSDPKRFRETSSQDGMEITTYATSDELVTRFGSAFGEAPFDVENPAVWSEGSGTDGTTTYRGPVRSSAAK